MTDNNFCVSLSLQRDANSPLNCSSISSISQYCLYSHSVDQLDANIEHYMKVLKKDPSFNTNLDSHPACWLTQLFSDGLYENSVVNTVFNILRRTGVNGMVQYNAVKADVSGNCID